MTESLLPADIVALANRVVSENAAIGRRIAVAESCTGGLVAAALTEIPGSSAVFDRGFVSYSNDAKHEMLGVARDIIDTFGAVSIATAWAMARGAIERCDADVALAITGVAGPSGGSDQKPVGTVVFSRCIRNQVGEPEGDRQTFIATSRAEVRRQATLWALELLLP